MYLQWVNFMVCKLYLNQGAKREKILTLVELGLPQCTCSHSSQIVYLLVLLVTKIYLLTLKSVLLAVWGSLVDLDRAVKHMSHPMSTFPAEV